MVNGFSITCIFKTVILLLVFRWFACDKI